MMFNGVSMQDAKYTGEKNGTNGIKTLMEACKIDDYRGVELLLNNGASATIQDFKGNDALYYAVTNNSLASIEVLIRLCGDKLPVERVYGKKKRSILIIAAIYCQEIDIIEYLLKPKIRHPKHPKFNPN